MDSRADVGKNGRNPQRQSEPSDVLSMDDRQTRTGETGEQIHVKGVTMWSILYSFLPYILMSVFASPPRCGSSRSCR